MANGTAAKSDFSKGNVAKTILRLSLPLMVAELVHVFYSLIDRMYIGHIPDVGTQCLTGIGLCIPLVSFIAAFAQLCATGGSSLMSIARGEGDTGKAERIQNTAFSMLVVFGVVLTLLMYFFADDVLMFIGADADTLPFALDYFSVYIIGTVFSLISLGMNPFINAQGFPTVGMITVLSGAVINLALDPLFIFTFGLGVRGAAWATVVAQVVSAAWVFRFLRGKKAVLRVTRFELDPGCVGKIMKLGITGFVFKATNSAAQAVVNATLKIFGGPLGVLYIGATSIINSLREVIHQPCFAITRGAQPVMSFNYGAKLYHRVLESIRFTTGAAVLYNLFIFIVLQLSAGVLPRIFSTDPELVALSAHCIRIYFAALVFMSFQQTAQHTFVALNKPKFALFFSLFRKAVLVIPLTLLLPRSGLGVEGVFWAEVISEVIGGIASYGTLMFTVVPELRNGEKKGIQA
ncbi:MAG: MATE family efflux transporter [Clostridia bacterium]|nr:MATE family efflux transporter [Clostridia bacterium]